MNNEPDLLERYQPTDAPAPILSQRAYTPDPMCDQTGFSQEQDPRAPLIRCLPEGELDQYGLTADRTPLTDGSQPYGENN